MPLPFETITPIPLNGPAAVPSLWNDRYSEIDDNFEFLAGGLLEATSDISDHDSRISAVEVAGPGFTSSAVKNDWHYRAGKSYVELWAEYWTLLNPSGMYLSTEVAMSGDFSLDVTTTAGLVLGYEYILSGGVVQETVVVAQLLSLTRVLFMSALQHSYSSGAEMRRTDFVVDQPGGKATAYDENTYFYGPMVLGSKALKSCVIIRNDDTNSPLLLYYKDASHTSWTAALWALKRTASDGTMEVEYVFPADSGWDIQAKIVCDASAPEDFAEIYGIVFLSEYSGLGGTPRTGETLNEITAANVIPLTSIAPMATASLLGRNTAGTGSPEVLAAATVRSILNVANGANNYSHPNHSGDVTSSGDGAQTIANNAVSLAKMADMATASLLGRNTAGVGDPEVLSAGTAQAMLGIKPNALSGSDAGHVIRAARVYFDVGTNSGSKIRIYEAYNAPGIDVTVDNMPAGSTTGGIFLSSNKDYFSIPGSMLGGDLLYVLAFRYEETGATSLRTKATRYYDDPHPLMISAVKASDGMHADLLAEATGSGTIAFELTYITTN